MARFQKTIVRYERDPRAPENAEFWEKWCCPCFLGTDDEGNTRWYGYTFDDLISEGKVHEIFYFDSYNLPEEKDAHYYEALRWAEQGLKECSQNLVMSLMQLGLLPQKEEVEFCGRKETREYCYVFEGYRFEHNVIKEVLGLDVEDNNHLTEEQMEQMREKQNSRWEWWGRLINNDLDDNFVDFKGLKVL